MERPRPTSGAHVVLDSVPGEAGGEHTVPGGGVLDQYGSLAPTQVSCRLRVEIIGGSARKQGDRERGGHRRPPRQTREARPGQQQEQRQRDHVMPAHDVNRCDERNRNWQGQQHNQCDPNSDGGRSRPMDERAR